MRVFQCIHKYKPHIPYFEKKYKIAERNLSFIELRELLIKDGYASTYILKPALEGKSEQVFYTVWDYERLQHKWAEEQGLKTRELNEIKLAQIESFNPAVFYNHSPRNDKEFVERLKDKKIINVCWDAIITDYPWLHEKYDLRLTLFDPFVRYWQSNGLPAALLTPAFTPTWEDYIENQRQIDVLFYGQLSKKLFLNRNQLITKLLEWKSKNEYNVRVHLQGLNKKKPLINLRGLRRLTKWVNETPALIRNNALPPIYGEELYRAIGNSKIVVNTFGDYNGLFKENMRNYEALGLGALMIGEDGIYPDFITPGQDFLTFKHADELIEKLQHALNNPQLISEMASRAHNKLKQQCSKEVQWAKFCDLVEKVS